MSSNKTLEEQMREIREMQDAFRPLLDTLKRQRGQLDQPDHPDLPEIAREYAKQDFWLVREALNMAAGFHPGRSGWGRGEDFSLAKGCVGPGGSLKVVNPDEPVRKWQIRPRDFLEWATDKGLLVDPVVRTAVEGGVRPQESTGTAKATEVKKLQAEQRKGAVQAFIHELDRRCSKHNWNSTAMPVRWEDVHRVFYLVYPKVPKVSPETLADDFRVLGANCTPGRKAPNNKVLDNLFNV